EDGESSGMEMDAACGAECVVERIADEHMREARPPARARYIREDVRRHCLIEGHEELVTRQAAHRLQRAVVELAPEHSSEHEHASALVTQVREATRDHV